MSDQTNYELMFSGAIAKGATNAIVKNFIEQKVTPLLRGSASRKTGAKIKSNLSKYARFIENFTRHTATIIKSADPYLLEDIYEPLTIVSPVSGKKITINSYPKKLIADSRCTLITDAAGMGKSTLAKYIARSAIIDSETVPIFIELRRIRPNQDIIDSICREIYGRNPDADAKDEILQTLRNGGFLFIFDGFDESDESLRKEIVYQINRMAADFQYCQFIITSRPEYSETLFPEFERFNVSPLTIEQAHSIIKRLDKGGDKFKILISKIESTDVSHFLKTPLLVTLLYGAFDHRPTIPPKRTAFYRQVYDALFEDHDLSKGDAYERRKECNLDKEDFHKLIRSIGFESFKTKRDSYTKEEFDDLVSKGIERSALSAAELKKVSRDLIRTVPLFIKDGTDHKWCHSSFKEYFAAQYISLDMHEKKQAMISALFDSDDSLKYREIFQFLSETDLDLLYETCAIPLIAEDTQNANEEFEFTCLLISKAVEIYFAKVDNPEQAPSGDIIIKSVLEKCGATENSNPCWWLIARKTGLTIVTRLTTIGKKYLLLSSIDSKNFPPAKRDIATKTPAFAKWAEAYGNNQVSAVRDKEKLSRIATEIGGIENITNTLNIRIPSLKSCQHVIERVEMLKKRKLVDEFSEF